MNYEGVLLDVKESIKDDESVLELYFKNPKQNNSFTLTDKTFQKYFYALPVKGKEDAVHSKVNDLRVDGKNDLVTPANSELVEKQYYNEKRKAVKVSVFNSRHVKFLRDEIKTWKDVEETLEFDLSLEQTYIQEKKLKPMGWHKIKANEYNEVIDIREERDDAAKDLTIAAFDIEVYSKNFPDAEIDPIMLISYVKDLGKKTEVKKVFACDDRVKGLDYVVMCANEKDLIEKFTQRVQSDEVDVLMGYNSDEFDVKYLKKRSEKLKAKFNLGRDGKPPRLSVGKNTSAKITGRPHYDVYRVLMFLDRVGSINLPKYTLKNVYEHTFNEKLVEIKGWEISKTWDEDPELVAKYNLSDSIGCYKLGMEFIGLNLELCMKAGLLLEAQSRQGTGTMVEHYLTKESRERGWLIPRRPRHAELMQRQGKYEGAYVKEPEPGLKEGIIEFDFGAFYPNIIISHNISYETANLKDCKDKVESPTGDEFCQDTQGFFPVVLNDLLKKRKKAKNELKACEKNSTEWQKWNHFQTGLKILANSFYGYLGFPRSRWYSRESASSITAWAREYIKESIQKSESAGFKVLYADTDSLYAEIPEGKTEKDLKEFEERLNNDLPGTLELEFENVYKRGLFVAAKGGGGAKKKYALIDREGNLKIRGFEFVRGDWAEIAKDTQMRVLEAILKEGDEEKALNIVKETIQRLKEKKACLDELVIHTQLTKALSEYEVQGPHTSAARKAIEKGEQYGAGSMIDYVITSNGKSISDKSVTVKHVKEGDYDVDYYVNNQVVPAAFRILSALGYSKEDLLQDGSQKNLNKWFS